VAVGDVDVMAVARGDDGFLIYKKGKKAKVKRVLLAGGLRMKVFVAIVVETMHID